MKICNFGSINIDHVYTLPHFVGHGETIDTSSYTVFPGGKGLNQSIALARAGARVHHAGAVGRDGTWLRDMMEREGIGVEHVMICDEPTGHAVIQVIPSGENAIFIHGGANRSFSSHEISRIIGSFSENDYLLIQNEINEVPYIMQEAARRKLRIVFNPAPMHESVRDYPLHLVDMMVVNEVEGAALTSRENPEEILLDLRDFFRDSAIVLTLGVQGVLYADSEHETLAVPACAVDAVDTTAAGDTFIGFLLGSLCQGLSVSESLGIANRASALCITRPGAASSIPRKSEVDELLQP